MLAREILSFLDKNSILYEKVRVEESSEIEGYSSLFNYKEGTLTFVAPERRFEDSVSLFTDKKIQFIIIGKNEKDYGVFDSVIRVNDPRDIFFKVLDGLLARTADDDITGVSSNPNVYKAHSYVSDKAIIGENVRIGVGCVIEGNVVIGDNTEIHHNVVIRNNTKIGKNCTIHSGVIIGEYGFGYIQNPEGKIKMLKHYGGVTIEDDVHIGDNSVIIRGALDDTVIHRGAKLNTMVHIAHNDSIGEWTKITSPCHVCGSVTIGEKCHIAGVAIRNQRNVGAHSTVGLGAVVVKDVEEGTTVIGNPAKSMVKGEKK